MNAKSHAHRYHEHIRGQQYCEHIGMAGIGMKLVITEGFMKTGFLTSLVVACVLCLPFSLQASTLDERLVGKWQGERSSEGKCKFLAWNMLRTDEGKFRIFFFSDAERKRLVNVENGRWEAENGLFSIFTSSVSTPDVYNYSVTDANTVRFSNAKRDPSADCMADYEFTDHRVVQ